MDSKENLIILHLIDKFIIENIFLSKAINWWNKRKQNIGIIIDNIY